MLRLLTAGESHGKAVMAILEGMPAGVPLSREGIDRDLRHRQGGYGRGKRMQIERDEVELLSGVRHGYSLGSPITLLVQNRDHAKWQDVMNADPIEGPVGRRLTRPRPGHADLAGGLKYGRKDLRDVLERASARSTVARVAAGAVCRQLLAPFGVHIAGHVVALGDVKARPFAVSVPTTRDFERWLTRDAGLTRMEARAVLRSGLSGLQALRDAGRGFDDDAVLSSRFRDGARRISETTP